MATFGHIAVAAAAARLGVEREAPRRRVLLATVGMSMLAMAPDLDVIAFSLGIPYAHEWGHRGAAHSLVFALLLTVVVFGLGRWLGRWSWRIGVAIAVVLVSHGLLDTITNGGLGIAVLWPFSDARMFAPWQPLEVAPIGRGMLSERGLRIIFTEAILFSPCLVIALWPRRRAEQSAPVLDDGPEATDPEEVTIPIDGTLDLHNFRPPEVGDLVREYVAECHARGLVELRIVHGKGIGNLRRTVHAALEKLPEVESFELAGGGGGSWGATLVTLRREEG